MESSQEKNPYLDREGNEIDFDKKRLKFWLETVPSDLRRLEYEFYKRNRQFINADLYRFENKEEHGRFTIVPGFTDDLNDEALEEFRNSFLKGEERKERFSEIVESTQRDLPMLLEKNADVIPEDKIRLIALGGSSFLGPRKSGKKLSDIDINFLIDQEDDRLNFDVLPDAEAPPEAIPYHIFGTGYSDEARGKGRQLHWLLYPHFPIDNKISDEELKDIIEQLIISTEQRKDKILESIKNLDVILKEKSRDSIIE